MEDDRNYYNLVPIKEEINDVSSFEKWAELNFGVNPYSMPPQSEPEVLTQQMITTQATSELFTIGIEEKKNAGTSVQLTVVIDLDSRLSVDDIVVSDLFVPTHLQQPAPNAKYSLWMKLTGETEDGIEIDLTMSRCDKCKYRMMYKNKDEANSSRFCDVMSSKLTTTRRRGGGVPYDALQIQFRCTPVKCHKLSSVVTLELFLMDAFGKIVSKPNQKAKMKFRTSEKRSKSERMDSVSQPVSDLQRNIEKQFSNIFKDEDLSDALVKKLTKLKKLVNLSLEKNVQYENMGNDNSGKYSSTDSDSDEAYTPKMRKSF